MKVFINTCDSLYCTVRVPGWPGAHHSVDICEGLEEWSGGQDTFHPSDTEEEALVQLVRRNTDTLDTMQYIKYKY